MFQFIDNLRQKPDKTKKQVAFLVAFFITGIIFVVWLSVIYPNFKNQENKEAVASSTESSPFSTFSSTFGSGFKALGEQFGELKDTISSITAEPAYYVSTSTGQ